MGHPGGELDSPGLFNSGYYQPNRSHGPFSWTSRTLVAPSLTLGGKGGYRQLLSHPLGRLLAMSEIERLLATPPAAAVDHAAVDRLPGTSDTDPFWRLAAAFIHAYPTSTARSYFTDLCDWARWCNALDAHPLTARRHRATPTPGSDTSPPNPNPTPADPPRPRPWPASSPRSPSSTTTPSTTPSHHLLPRGQRPPPQGLRRVLNGGPVGRRATPAAD